MPTIDRAAVDPATVRREGRRQYAKSEAVRQRILEACIEAFGATGFHGATMKDIAQRAGISQTGLMHHFPSKRDLLVEVLAMRDEQMELIMGDLRHDDFFEGQIRIILDNVLHPGLMELHSMISAEATASDHPAHDDYRERYDSLRKYLEALFDEARQQGRLLVEGSSRSLANVLVAAIDGLQLQWLYNADDVDIVDGIRTLLRALLRETAE